MPVLTHIFALAGVDFLVLMKRLEISAVFLFTIFFIAGFQIPCCILDFYKNIDKHLGNPELTSKS